MHEELTLVLTDITEAQTMALAQFVKRVGWTDIRQNAVDDDEAYQMRDAIVALQKALDFVGYSPR